MKVVKTYVVKIKSLLGDYNTLLVECSDKKWWQLFSKNKWFLLEKTQFHPGTIFSGLNELFQISEKQALELIKLSQSSFKDFNFGNYKTKK